jgi:cytochrome c556
MRPTGTVAAALFAVSASAALAQDARQMVRLPPPMQEHMLANMRDHLSTLNDILGDVAEGKYEDAAKLAEQRLGMSSLAAHGAAHLAPFMPQQMQDIGTGMHHAASRLVIVLQNAATGPGEQSIREVNGALHEVTSTCAACHASYKIR